MSTRRTLHLIRHGNYTRNPISRDALLSMDESNLKLDGGLSPLGKEQARYTARRLLDHTIHALHASTLPRALQTANIIADHLDDALPLSTTQDLWECMPSVPSHLKPEVLARLGEGELTRSAQKAQRAFDLYFTPTAGADDTTEVLICHGNLIRYFVTRVLGIEPDIWTRMRTHHCGITTVLIPSGGRMSLVCYNDTGHLPAPMVTS